MINGLRELLLDLISIPSVSSDRTECERVVRYVADCFRDSGLIVEEIAYNNSPSLLVSTQGQRAFDILLLGHLDVVPADSEAFRPTVRGDRVYGRGAADMKSGCASLISLQLTHRRTPAYRNVGLLLTTDEELGGFNGVGHLVSTEGLRAKVVVNPDGPDTLEPLTLCLAEKGILLTEMVSQGTPAHGATPWLGENAIDKLWQDVTKVRSVLGAATAADPWSTSVNLGLLQGGTAANSVPDSARALLDMRFGEQSSRTEIKRRVSELCVNSTVTFPLEADPVFVRLDHPAVQVMFESLKGHEMPAKHTREFGASDARWFSSQGAAIIMMLPECSRFHIREEWVSLSSLELFHSIIADFVMRYVAAGENPTLSVVS